MRCLKGRLPCIRRRRRNKRDYEEDSGGFGEFESQPRDHPLMMSATHSDFVSFDLLLGIHEAMKPPLLGSPKECFPGLVNFVIAVAYHFYLTLPVVFSQPRVRLL